MRIARIAGLALIWGLAGACTLSGQGGYGSPPPPQNQYDPNYDQRDDYRNDGYDRDRYDRDRYDDYRSPRYEVGFFYDELSPYGDWVRTRDYGWAWFPRDVHSYWRPYADGRWVNSEYGWTWVSYEPFGWATYHYGRWTRDVRYGWLWVPGTIWGPAWVSWQSGGGYIGWAPLPPQIGFEVGIGIRLGGFNLSVGIRPDWYSFVPERSFLDTRLSGYVLPTARNVTIINNTTNITNYTYVDNRVINQGVDVRAVERATGKRVQRYRVAESTSPERTDVARDEVRIFRPQRQRLDTVRAAPQLNAGRRPEPVPQVQQQQQQQQQQQGTMRPNRPEVTEGDVAPRANRGQQPDVRKIDQQAAREKQELTRHQSEEKRQVARIHEQELARAKAREEREQVEKRNQAEREALQQEQREATQQLEARQKAKRQAAVSTPPPEKPAPPATKKRGRGKPVTDEDEDKAKGKKNAPPEPPPV